MRTETHITLEGRTVTAVEVTNGVARFIRQYIMPEHECIDLRWAMTKARVEAP